MRRSRSSATQPSSHLAKRPYHSATAGHDLKLAIPASAARHRSAALLGKQKMQPATAPMAITMYFRQPIIFAKPLASAERYGVQQRRASAVCCNALFDGNHRFEGRLLTCFNGRFLTCLFPSIAILIPPYPPRNCTETTYSPGTSLLHSNFENPGGVSS